MNIFTKKEVAQEYDAYYSSKQGKEIDQIEKQAIRQLLKPVKPGEMLEIGCGTGHWTAFFSEMGFQLTATDVSDVMLSIAKVKSIPNVTFSKADVLQLPFPNSHFDQIAVVTALEFCGDIDQAFSEIKRVLKPNGWLVAGCLNANSILGKTKDQDPVFRHGHFMSKFELQNHLSEFGSPKIIESVYLSEKFELLDHTDQQHTTEGVFMAASVKKISHVHHG